MSWQASEAVRDYSQSKGATRTVAFVLATYADKYGNDIFIALDRLMKEARVGRKAAVDGRRWLVDNGEAELVDRPDGKPKMRGRVRVMSMAPLMACARRAKEAAEQEADEGSLTEPIDEGFPTEPHPNEGSPTEPIGVRSGAQGVRSAPSIGSVSEPESEGTRTEPEDETPDARAGARAIIRPFEQQRTEVQLRAERREIETEISTLESQLASGQNPSRTQAAIDRLRAELDELPTEAVAA